jgi:FAD/FMN-containing dehydrogenase
MSYLQKDSPEYYAYGMDSLKTQIESIIKGEVANDEETRELYSHDASMFELKPEVVASPKDSEDVQALVRHVAANKSG